MNKLPKKFSSVKEIIQAYVQLEKEFTKRCNLNKEMQAELEEVKNQLEELKLTMTESSEKKVSDTLKEEIIKEFLSGIKNAKSDARLLGGGEAVRTPSRKPKNLEEANLMAKYFLLGD